MIRAVALTALLAGPAPAGAPLIPRFTPETASGLNAAFTGGWEQIVGGGAAAFDCDDDGFPDLAVAGGDGPARFFRNAAARGGPLRFSAETAGVEVDGVAGFYPLDVDGDGIADLMALRAGPNLLLRGLGGCRFAPAPADWAFDPGDDWSPAFAATWEQGAEWPTLAVGNYIDRREEAFPWGSCTANTLQRPEPGARRFAPAAPLTPSFCALSMLFTDWDRSGRRDLRVANDREYYKGGQEQLWRMEPGAPPRPWTEAEGWKRLRIWGMGLASHDLTGDGRPDYFVTSMADNKLQTLAGDGPSFADIALARGVTAHRPHAGDDIRPSTAWHAQFEDVNNDGRVDLFIAKGNVWNMPDFAEADPNNLLLQGADGDFSEASVAAGVASMAQGRGALVTDFNLDGRLDLLVVNRNAPVELWRNDGPAGGWLMLRLRDRGANRDAIGAWIEARVGDRVQRREITVGGGHASGALGWAHVGLHDGAAADVRVIWPDGATQDFGALAAGGFHILPRGEPARPWRSDEGVKP